MKGWTMQVLKDKKRFIGKDGVARPINNVARPFLPAFSSLEDMLEGKIHIPIKPLSVNDAWKGRRFSSDEYKKYQKQVEYELPEIVIPPPPYEVYFKFGFSSRASDWDNPVKPLQDCLAKRYGFNDKLIRRAVIETEIVPKGSEYFEFQITSL